MFNLKLQDKVPCSETRRRTKMIDITEYTLRQKWRRAGHIATMKNNRCQDQTLHRVATKEREETKRTTKQKMARRHNKEGGNHLQQGSNRQKVMDGIDGEIHPAVGGQSLGDR